MQLVPYRYRSDTVQFASQLKRKCLICPEPVSNDNPSFSFPIDFDGSLPKAVTVPVYPEEGDESKFWAEEDRFGLQRIISVNQT